MPSWRFWRSRVFVRSNAGRFYYNSATPSPQPRHNVITLLLSPNWSVSTPMQWARRRRRLLMWASVFTGRLQTW